MNRTIALCALCALLLSGCAGQDGSAAPSQQDTGAAALQTQALTQAGEAGLLDDGQKDDMPADGLLTEQDAAALVAERLRGEGYTVALTDIRLETGQTDDNNLREYFVFEVKDAQGASVGQVAVDKQTGEKYNYLGAGTLDDYDTFPLYDPETEEMYDWAGAYTGPAAVALEILQGDESSFAYSFSDGTTGNARVKGNTAKSDDEEISFLFSEDIITVVGGGLTGNYTARAADR